MKNRTAIVVSIVVTAIVVGSATYLLTPKGGGEEELTVDDVKSFIEGKTASTVKDILSVVPGNILEESMPEPEPVTIGQIWPLSGAQQRSGEKHQRGLELRVQEVNDDGGIKSLRGAEIEVLTGNNQGDPDTSRSEAERLINQDISALVGCYTSDTTLPTADLSQQNEIPMMVCAGNPAIPGTGDYIYRAHNGIFETVEVSLSFLRNNTDVQRISLLMEDAGYGPPAFKTTKSFADKMGFEIVSSEKFPAGTTSFQSELQRIKDANADAIVWVGYVSESISFVQQMKQYDVNVDALIQPGGGGLNDIDFVSEVGSLANYCLVGTYYSKAAPTFHNEEYKQNYEEKYGQPADFLAEEAYEATAVLLNAIERAGSRDPAEIKEAIANTHMTWTAGPIEFGEHQYAPDQFGSGFNIYNNSVVVQVQDQDFVTVYPDDVATGSANLPMPDWGER